MTDTNLFGQSPWARRGEDSGRIQALETRVTSAESRLAVIETPLEVTTYRNVAANGMTNSATYVDFPGPADLAFVKTRTPTALLVVLLGASYADANMVTQVGVRIDSTDADVAYFFHNAAGRHDAWGGAGVVFSGLAAGPYTARLRWKMGGTGGNIAVDGNDLFSLIIQEVAL